MATVTAATVLHHFNSAPAQPISSETINMHDNIIRTPHIKHTRVSSLLYAAMRCHTAMLVLCSATL